MDPVTKDRISLSASSTVQGVFHSSLTIGLYHGLFTWLFLELAGLRLAFLSAVAASFLALIPVLSPWILMVPHSLYLYLVSEVPMPFCLLYLLSYYLVSTNSFTSIYNRHLDVHPYVIGLSVFLGYLTMAA